MVSTALVVALAPREGSALMPDPAGFRYHMAAAVASSDGAVREFVSSLTDLQGAGNGCENTRFKSKK